MAMGTDRWKRSLGVCFLRACMAGWPKSLGTFCQGSFSVPAIPYLVALSLQRCWKWTLGWSWSEDQADPCWELTLSQGTDNSSGLLLQSKCSGWKWPHWKWILTEHKGSVLGPTPAFLSLKIQSKPGSSAPEMAQWDICASTWSRGRWKSYFKSLHFFKKG